ncbi:methylated-DNA--[protein]-cysteine S-methyltransferase [Aestuariibacter salexigens]|uniref:methylated-DNA--[protein]-cysteine S-methyltransferase n=1 Tax=Aestuariibacter salexigens TaxID=226010 RepID=UPI0004218F63|nr:methylated-DNA--[protein]-cysteine S-methyltransferase [Aestuariibacter salexigens]
MTTRPVCETYRECIYSPLGNIAIRATNEFIQGIEFTDDPIHSDGGNSLTNFASQQLTDYFDGRLLCFDLPLAPQGTAFQKRVWQALQNIPFGHTASYRDIAVALQNPNAVRAVGAANGRNPIAIVIPCHRIIGADGSLTGYASGLARKKALLELEHHQRSLAL